jgi:predicted DNA-binding transcriptional regulator AlpA
MSIPPTPSGAHCLLTQEDAARLLGLKNPRTLAAWRLRRCGPPFRKLGKRLIRYDAAQVLAWATTQQETRS